MVNFRKNYAYIWLNYRKSEHLNFAMGATLHRYAIGGHIGWKMKQVLCDAVMKGYF